MYVGMSLKKARDRYLVKPGSTVKISKVDSNEKTLFDGDKESSLPVLDELRAELKELQNQLYAQDRKKLLVVIQAMDTGGKDGCVKAVFATVDPQGIHVEAFKKPTEDELAHDFLWRVHAKVPRNGTRDQNIHPVDLPVSLIRLIRHVTRGINPPSK